MTGAAGEVGIKAAELALASHDALLRGVRRAYAATTALAVLFALVALVREPVRRHTTGDRMTALAALQARALARSAPEPDEGLIVCANRVWAYRTEGVEVQALQGPDLTVEADEVLAVVGASGSGKSTVLGILSGLDLPTAGRAGVAHHDLLAMKRRERLDYRRSTVGFVWQQTGRTLLPYLTAPENVTLPMGYAFTPCAQRAGRAMELLGLLGIADCCDRRPDELSGGQQQRVAIAVAGANTPRVLFADEPTGEPDTAGGEEVFAALRRTNAEPGVTVLIVTHDPAVSEQVRRTVRIRDGRTATEVLRPSADGRARRRAARRNTPCSTGSAGSSCRGSTPSSTGCTAGSG